MASLFTPRRGAIRLLDAGAAVGSLSAAFVGEVCTWETPPTAIHATAYEVDAGLVGYLASTFEDSRRACSLSGIGFVGEIEHRDFIRAGAELLGGGLFALRRTPFNFAILNPPYKKIHSDSEARRLLRTIGIETSNLYTGFLSIVIELLEPGGELVAITPRSFCNGPYFKHFRKAFLDAMTLRRIHVFTSRDEAFGDDDVLQENVVFHAVKEHRRPGAKVIVSASADARDEFISVREVEHERIVRPGDAHQFIHVVPDELGQQVADRMASFTTTLEDLGLTVSTGRVVDFRVEEFLRSDPEPGAAPLIYPGHLAMGFVAWPKPGGKKPNALAMAPETNSLLMPGGVYVLVKRFSAKEERRRVVAAVSDPARLPVGPVGFENHLNVFHSSGAGLPMEVARGLAAFLNSSLVDEFFRQFNGHTQVNATDLRSLNYPDERALRSLGSAVGETFPAQADLDRSLEEMLNVTNPSSKNPGKNPGNPVAAKRRIEEALGILKQLGLPREQHNERSALTLLALVDLKPEGAWKDLSDPLMGITPMMEFFARHYGKRYMPNARETVRRQTIHQFVDAGLVQANPDDLKRAQSSAKTVYRIAEGALSLLRTFGSPTWEAGVAAWVASAGALAKRYAQEREMERLPVTLAPGKSITLSPGGQNVLIKTILDEFCPRFTPSGRVLYVGDTDQKWAHCDEAALAELGVTVDAHGKMPDLVVHHVKLDWLVLIEAVTSHGPVDPKRRKELASLFAGSKYGLVYVTAFLSRKAMVKYLDQISWETEVWVAESPGHMIHFNGERFLGPY